MLCATSSDCQYSSGTKDDLITKIPENRTRKIINKIRKLFFKCSGNILFTKFIYKFDMFCGYSENLCLVVALKFCKILEIKLEI